MSLLSNNYRTKIILILSANLTVPKVALSLIIDGVTLVSSKPKPNPLVTAAFKSKNLQLEKKALYGRIFNAFEKNLQTRDKETFQEKNKNLISDQKFFQNSVSELMHLLNKGQFNEVNKQTNVLKNTYPHSVEIWHLHGISADSLGMADQAIEAAHKITQLRPKSAKAFNNLGILLRSKGDLSSALKQYKKALELDPSLADAHFNKGNIYRHKGSLTLAKKSYKKAIELNPGFSEAFNNLGNVLKDQGHIKEAVNSYDCAINLRHDNGNAYRNLSKITEYDPWHPHISKIETLLQNEELQNEDRCQLHYAMAKIQEDLGNFGEAFENLMDGGKLRSTGILYDPQMDVNLFKGLKETFKHLSKNTVLQNEKSRRLTPTFIIGMPRSGTTLVEQILSCHPNISAAGELTHLSKFGHCISVGIKPITNESLLHIRNSYIDAIDRVSNGKSFVVDKMPQNFLYLGLISTIFPEAKIIHVQRDPAATCWSNFKHYFSSNGLGYSYDLNNTVRYYKLYQSLMNFWAANGVKNVYSLDYDALTVDQEYETKKLISYLGLKWTDECLLPHKNKRSVLTASQQQVRKKIYRGSSKEWKRFEPHLNGLFDELVKDSN